MVLDEKIGTSARQEVGAFYYLIWIAVFYGLVH